MHKTKTCLKQEHSSLEPCAHRKELEMRAPIANYTANVYYKDVRVSERRVMKAAIAESTSNVNNKSTTRSATERRAGEKEIQSGGGGRYGCHCIRAGKGQPTPAATPTPTPTPIRPDPDADLSQPRTRFADFPTFFNLFFTFFFFEITQK